MTIIEAKAAVTAGRRPMAGMFELFNDEESGFRFRITAPDGTVMAVSRSFADKPSAVAGIRDVREYAGMGHITDLCPTPPADAATGPSSVPNYKTRTSAGSRDTRLGQSLTWTRAASITAAA
jgi:uncharacterized protein YegP (UPF0339 family)